MAEYIETVVVGGGHAGLAMSWCLTERKLPHAVLERGEVAESWERRWDTVALQFPNVRAILPGLPWDGKDPDGFKQREDILAWLRGYAASFNAPVRTHTNVNVLRGQDGSPRYLLETTAGDIEAANVVIATGAYQVQRIPPYAPNVPPEIQQIPSDTYKNPAQLPPGATLVVGTGASAVQIADDMVRAGKRCYLSVGKHRRVPRRYRGMDSTRWQTRLSEAGISLGTGDRPLLTERGTIPSPMTGSRGGYDINLREFAQRGLVLLGRLEDIRDGKLYMQPGLKENLDAADAAFWEFRKRVDDFIQDKGIEAPPPEPHVDPPASGEGELDVTELALEGTGITSIIWAIGYEYDWNWVKLPLFTPMGEPISKRGVVAEYPGIYFLGLRGLSPRASGFGGAAEDAAFLAGEIATRMGKV